MEQTIDYKGYKIEVSYDCDPLNPREEFDNLGTIAYKHSRYTIGEEEISDPIDWLLNKLDKKMASTMGYDNETLHSLENLFFKQFGGFKLYLMDHSGLTLSTSPFGGIYGHFDSGQVGYIYCSLPDAIENWNLPKNSTWSTLVDNWFNKGQKITLLDIAKRILQCEIDDQAAYLSGEVYTVSIIDPDTDEASDRCGGYFGDPEKSGAIEEAKAQIDRY